MKALFCNMRNAVLCESEKNGWKQNSIAYEDRPIVEQPQRWRN